MPLTPTRSTSSPRWCSESDRLQQGARRLGQGDQRAVQGRAASTARRAAAVEAARLIDLLRAAALPAGLALVALLVFFGLVRPAVKAALAARPAQPARPGRRIDAVVDDEHAPARRCSPRPPTCARSKARRRSPRTTRPPSPASCAAGSTAAKPPDPPSTNSSTTMALDEAGLEDAAILLMSLGEEEAADVFKHLAPQGSAEAGRDDRAHEVDPARARRRACSTRFSTIAASRSTARRRHRRIRARPCCARRSARTRPTC